MRRRWTTCWSWCCPTSWGSPRRGCPSTRAAGAPVGTRQPCAVRDRGPAEGGQDGQGRCAGGTHGRHGARSLAPGPRVTATAGRDRTARPSVELDDDMAARGRRAGQDRSVARTIQAVAVAPPRNPGMGTDHGPYSTARSAIVAVPGRHREEVGRLRLQARDPPPRGGLQADQAFHVWHVGAGATRRRVPRSPHLYIGCRGTDHQLRVSEHPAGRGEHPIAGTLMEVQSRTTGLPPPGSRPAEDRGRRPTPGNRR